MSIVFLDDRFGSGVNVTPVVSGFYRKDGSPRIDLVDAETGEPWACCTVCLDQAPSAADRVFLKDYSENKGLPALLMKHGVVCEIVGGFDGFTEYRLSPAMVAMVEAARKEEGL